jgi:hypothetical protein
VYFDQKAKFDSIILGSIIKKSKLTKQCKCHSCITFSVQLLIFIKFLLNVAKFWIYNKIVN